MYSPASLLLALVWTGGVSRRLCRCSRPFRSIGYGSISVMIPKVVSFSSSPQSVVRLLLYYARRLISASTTTPELSLSKNKQEDAKAEANDLLLRVESKAAKEHVKACLHEKANKGELADLRGCLDR